MTARHATESLWGLVGAVSERARQSGSLQPIETDLYRLAAGDELFQVRQLNRPSAKSTSPSGVAANPFLPFDPALFVREFGTTHLGLLNKYNVVDNHLLLITREFQSQDGPLSLRDFQVASEALAAGPALLFFNSGAAAGASQSHRHLQLIPLPVSADPGGFPLARRLLAGTLPMPHALLSTAELDPGSRAERWYAFYCTNLVPLGLAVTGSDRLSPYNLLATAEGLVLIPRSCGAWRDLSVNALGFAGMLLVKNAQQRRLLEALGAWSLLSHVALDTR